MYSAYSSPQIAPKTMVRQNILTTWQLFASMRNLWVPLLSQQTDQGAIGIQTTHNEYTHYV